jgi:hypothetical protein
MWPFRRKPDPPPDKDVGERLDDLEDDIKHLNRRFTRLQQQVTRWSRDYDEDEAEDGDEFQELLDRNRRTG